MVVFLLFILTNCKSTKSVSDKSNSTTEPQDLTKTKGKVTHQYKTTGCATIIICEAKNSDTLFLIPATPITDFDKDGLEILFNYRIVKIHNPKGCSKGIPAQITDIEIRKSK